MIKKEERKRKEMQVAVNVQYRKLDIKAKIHQSFVQDRVFQMLLVSGKCHGFSWNVVSCFIILSLFSCLYLLCCCFECVVMCSHSSLSFCLATLLSIVQVSSVVCCCLLCFLPLFLLDIAVVSDLVFLHLFVFGFVHLLLDRPWFWL